MNFVRYSNKNRDVAAQNNVKDLAGVDKEKVVEAWASAEKNSRKGGP